MKFCLRLVAVLASSLVAAFDHQPPIRTRQSQSVNTTSGPVTSHPGHSIANVSAYLGIPFAKPPVGALRFAPPVKYEGTTAINGTNFGFSCAATTLFAAAGGSASKFDAVGANLTAAGIEILETFAQIGEKFSEDCLTLNIWVPSGGEAKKAIMLWIYGGGFTTGSTITATYRLGIFGFPGNPSVPNKNLGLLDQRLAIEWTRDNIANFGGDPSRITIFGQSAGSASVDYYSYAYTSDPIVAGFIAESGTINGFNSSTSAYTTGAWFNVSTALGCGSSTSNSTDVLSCMQTKDFTSVLQAVANTSSNFGPTVDDLTVFSDYPARSSAGNFIKVPLLIGNTDYEDGLYATLTALQDVTYPRSYWELEDLTEFSCPAAVRANISITAGVSTWRYRWFGAFPNTRLTTVPDSGAYHTSELLILFDNLPSGIEIPQSTPEEISIGKYIRGAWAAFAKDPTNGLKTYQGGWPQYDPSAETLIRLAYNNLTGPNLAAPLLYDAPCQTVFSYNGTSSNATSPTGSATGSSSSTSSAPSATKSSAGGRNTPSAYFLVIIALMWLCTC